MDPVTFKKATAYADAIQVLTVESSDITNAAANVLLTGYTKPGSATAIAATHTINQAIGMVERGVTDNTDAIALKSALANLAAPYSAAATYALGAYCTVSGVLKKANVAIAAPEAYNASKWDDAPVGAQLAAKVSRVSLTQAAYDALVAAGTLDETVMYYISDATNDPLSVDPIVVVNANASPALGTVVHNREYRCTGSVTTAPTLTLAAIAANSTLFTATVIFTAPDTTAPVVTNSSGKTLKYKGDGVSAGTFTPVASTTYRMSFLWDGVYLNCFIVGVS